MICNPLGVVTPHTTHQIPYFAYLSFLVGSFFVPLPVLERPSKSLSLFLERSSLFVAPFPTFFLYRGLPSQLLRGCLSLSVNVWLEFVPGQLLQSDFAIVSE